MSPQQILTLVSSLGLTVQTAAALLLAALFLLLYVKGGRRSFFRDWMRAWVALAIALSALLLRYVSGKDWAFFELDPSRLAPAVHAVYQLGKFAFAYFLLIGALRFTAPHTRGRAQTAIAVAFAVLAALSLAIAPGLESIITWQALAMTGALIGSGVLLLRSPGPRKSFGTQFTAVTLLVYSAVWVAYAIAFWSTRWWEAAWPESSHPLAVLTAFNCYVDLLFQVLIGCGMLVLLLQDLNREAEESRVERSRLQHELAQVDKMRTIGSLVSGVAHELNNPLTSIVGFSEFLEGEQLSDDQREMARTIREQALRCRSIVRSLSVFAGERSDRIVPFDPRELVERVARGFGPQLESASVRLALDLAGERATLRGDPAGIEQVLSNLVSNAIHAAGRGGVVRIALSARAREVEIAVEDDGPGIPLELLPRIFEPFFTTKEPGTGTGLGLAMAQNIVRWHQGTIEASNLERSGARFTVRLPRTAPELQSTAAISDPLQTQDPEPRPAAAPARERALRILVVDDDGPLRGLLRSACARQGWSVEEAADGAIALEKIAAAAADRPFDAVVCDLKMPHVSGIEVHDRLAREYPDVLRRSIFITGDLASPEAAGFAARTRCRVLAKPFEIAQLVQWVERAANGEGETRAMDPALSPT